MEEFRNKKISEFDKIDLEDQNNLSYILIPLSVYDSEKNSYVNAIVNIGDIIKTSYSTVLTSILGNPERFWEVYGEDNTILDLS